mmetsp:Transcript_6019/g.21978  ORF Transcript_6019/g.21978 Transcript_6019/m.21978 type:complete len:202 (+) Transcript_6019:3255-3860(+)
MTRLPNAPSALSAAIAPARRSSSSSPFAIPRAFFARVTTPSSACSEKDASAFESSRRFCSSRRRACSLTSVLSATCPVVSAIAAPPSAARSRRRRDEAVVVVVVVVLLRESRARLGGDRFERRHRDGRERLRHRDDLALDRLLGQSERVREVALDLDGRDRAVRRLLALEDVDVRGQAVHRDGARQCLLLLRDGTFFVGGR